MQNGYVKIYRSALDTGWLKNHRLWAFWSYCLLKASYVERAVKIGFQEIDLQPGQFIFGRKIAAQELGMSENQIRTCIDSLKTTNNITIKTTNKYSIVTVMNWGLHQNGDYQNHHQNHQPVTIKTTNNSPTTHQQLTTNKNIKNIKKEISIKEKIQKKKVGEALAIVQYEISNLEEYRMSLLRSDERATHKQEICSLVSSVTELRELEGSLKAEALKESQADEAKLQSKPPEPKEEKPKKMGKNQYGFPKLTKGQIDKAKDLPTEHKCKDIFDFIWKNWGRRDDKAAARWAWYKVCLASTPDEIAELGKKLLRVVNYYRSTPNERHFCKKLGNFLNQGNHEELDAKYLEFTSARLLPEIPKEGEKKEKDKPKKVILVPTANRDQEDFERLQETVRKIEEREERDANNQ